jgi:hypothetical protein
MTQLQMNRPTVIAIAVACSAATLVMGAVAQANRTTGVNRIHQLRSAQNSGPMHKVFCRLLQRDSRKISLRSCRKRGASPARYTGSNERCRF